MPAVSFAETKFPTQEPIKGEAFGHRVTNLGDGLYVSTQARQQNAGAGLFWQEPR